MSVFVRDFHLRQAGSDKACAWIKPTPAKAGEMALLLSCNEKDSSVPSHGISWHQDRHWALSRGFRTDKLQTDTHPQAVNSVKIDFYFLIVCERESAFKSRCLLRPEVLNSCELGAYGVVTNPPDKGAEN